MITRPLDIASKLQPAPRSFDVLFYVNGVLIACFFLMFGSRFILAPGMALQLPEIVGARQGASLATADLSVRRAGEIFTDEGLLNDSQLQNWLRNKAKQSKHPSLLILADRSVPVGVVSEIEGSAIAAGFEHVQQAALEPSQGAP